MAATDAPVVTVANRAALRAWLSENHARTGPVWLATYKKHHPDYLAYEPMVEELLCWGWIDSMARALDAERTSLMIAPRNPKSAWSALNKAHVDRALASGAMTAHGMALVDAAKANGMWDFLNDVEALIAPRDLLEALQEAGQQSFWDGLPRSVRRGALEWIKTAKTPATRAKRIADVTTSAALGLRPTPFRR